MESRHIRQEDRDNYLHEKKKNTQPVHKAAWVRVTDLVTAFGD